MSMEVLNQAEMNEVSGGLTVAAPGLTLDLNPTALVSGLVGIVGNVLASVLGLVTGLVGAVTSTSGGLLGGLLGGLFASR